MDLYLSTLPGAVAFGIIWGIMAIGVYITYKVLDVADLTVDGSFASGGLVAAIWITSGGNPVLGMLFGFLVGMAAGLVTGLLHTLLGIPAILSGILTQLSLWSVNLVITSGRSNLSVSARAFDVLVSPLDIGGSIAKLALILAIIIGALYLFFGTELGASIRATGSNAKMARAVGINVKLNTVLGLMIANGIVGLAGSLFVQYQGAADIKMGTGAIVIGLCAVVIGGSIAGRILNFAAKLLGVALGGVVYYVIYQSVVFLGMPTDLLKLLAALVIVVLLGVPYLAKRHKRGAQDLWRRLIHGKEGN